MKYCNVITLSKLSYEIPAEYLNLECVLIVIIGDSANVLFDDESVWFVELESLEFSIIDYR